MAHEKWASQQVQAAVELGVNVLDAQSAVTAFLAMLPFGAAPDTYIVPAHRLEQDLRSARVIDDARSDWYARTDPRFARLLDASIANARTL